MAKKEKKAEVVSNFAKPTIHQYDVIVRPIITEKTMAMMQNQNKVTFEVSKKANAAEVKLAFEAIFKVEAVQVNIINVRSKSCRRGTQYPGMVPGYKKAIVTVKEGEAIDLFKE